MKEGETMDIESSPGDLIVVTERTKDNGDDFDKANISKYLEIGKPYKIEEIEVGGWYTDVWLEGIPKVKFNSVNFENYN